MGFIPPNNVAAVSGMRYYLVAIPDDDAYLAAAMGVYTELANHWKWGEEAEDPDSDQIEQQWLDAIFETLEMIMTNPLNTLIDQTDEIESLLRALNQVRDVCCPSNVTYLDPTNLPTDSGYHWDSELGSPPSTWGDGETVADADDYKQLLCAQADRYVDYLVDVASQFEKALAAGAIILGVVAAALTVLAGIGLLIEIAYLDAASAVSAIASGGVSGVFSGASDSIEAARDDIKCAFISLNPTRLSDIIQSTVSSLAWSIFFQYLDYASPLYIAETGEYNGEYLDVARDDSCDDCPLYEDSGFMFWVSAGSVHDEYQSDVDMHQLDMYYYRPYKAVGDHASVDNFQLNVQSDSTTKKNVKYVVTDTQKDAGCGDNPVILFFDKNLTLVDSVANSEVPGWTGEEDNSSRCNHQCSKDTASPYGYIEFYCAPASGGA